MTLLWPRSHAAHELAKEQRKNFGEDITSAVRYAKKKVSSLLCISCVFKQHYHTVLCQFKFRPQLYGITIG